MDAQGFATLCKQERDAMLAEYKNSSGSTAVANHLMAAGLNSNQREHVIKALDVALTDTFYTILMALDGEASLGAVQQEYRVQDENGNIVCRGDGWLADAAYVVFQSDES
nr:hypothetical protein [uncultured Hyphomonas sp.]